MKKLCLIVTMLMVSSFTFSQQTVSIDEFYENEQDEQVATVFSTIKIKRISGFGGPTMSYSSLGGEFAMMMGGGGGILINNFFVGGYGEGLSTHINTATVRNLQFGHGGIWMGYEMAPERMIHPVLSVRSGWGTASGVTENYYRVSDAVFVVLPAVSAEVNFTRFFKMNIGAEYRRTFDVNRIEGMSNNDFSNVGVYMNFIFGWF